jgi:hypothetical protein
MTIKWPTPRFLRLSEVPITFSRSDQWTSFFEPGIFHLFWTLWWRVPSSPKYSWTEGLEGSTLESNHSWGRGPKPKRSPQRFPLVSWWSHPRPYDLLCLSSANRYGWGDRDPAAAARTSRTRCCEYFFGWHIGHSTKVAVCRSTWADWRSDAFISNPEVIPRSSSPSICRT